MVQRVAYDTSDSQFESSHQKFLFTINCIEKTKIKKKAAEYVLIFRWKIAALNKGHF